MVLGMGLADVATEVQSLRDALVTSAKKRYAKETSKGTDLKHVTAPLQAAIELVSIIDRVLSTICPSPSYTYTPNNALLPEWMDAYRQVLDLLRSSLNREVPHYLLENRVKVRQ